jgi:hypothetical protein
METGISIPLVIPLHSNVRWGSAYNMLNRAYQLRQVRNSLGIEIPVAHTLPFRLSNCSLPPLMNYMGQ